MLAIRMQRTGRKGHAMFRVVVQDSRRAPTSGKVVARLGSYDPHAKTATLDKEKASFYLEHGAQPSERVAYLLKQEGVKLPNWVNLAAGKKRDVRNADKRRSTRPEEPAEETSAEATTEPAASTAEGAETAEAPVAEDKATVVADSEETPAANEESDTAAEKPADQETEKAADAGEAEAKDGDKLADKKG